jgi:uncharacterized SAM-binding protein YcdF (DUF218 family)
LIWILLQLKTLSRELILPPTGPLLLALIGLLLFKARPRLSRIFVVTGVAALWLFSMPIVSDALTRIVERFPPVDLAQAQSAQAIVILGGGGQRGFAPEYGGPAAEPFLLERLTYGAYLSHKLGLPVLVTGFWTEATAMHDTLQRNFGIEARWVDSQAYDTYLNAKNSARLLQADGVHRIVLVTRATHMPRSVHEFTDVGFDVVPAPVGMFSEREVGIYRFLPTAEALDRSHAAVYEMLGEPVRRFLSATHLRRHQETVQR